MSLLRVKQALGSLCFSVAETRAVVICCALNTFCLITLWYSTHAVNVSVLFSCMQWLGPSFICRLWQGFRHWIDTGLYFMEYSKVRSYYIQILSQVDKLYYVDVFLYFLKSPSQAFSSMATSRCFTVFNYRACCRMGKPWNAHGVTSLSRKKMDVTGSAAWCAKQKSVGSLNKLDGAQM